MVYGSHYRGETHAQETGAALERIWNVCRGGGAVQEVGGGGVGGKAGGRDEWGVGVFDKEYPS